MVWKQVIDPFGNSIVSVLVAAIPILFIFWALIIKKMKGYQASLFATLIALLIAIFVMAHVIFDFGSLFAIFLMAFMTTLLAIPVMALFIFAVEVLGNLGTLNYWKNPLFFMKSTSLDPFGDIRSFLCWRFP